MKHMMLAVLITMAPVATGLAADVWQETREFPASPGQTLTLDLHAGGSVKVTGSGGSQFLVSYEVGGRDGADLDVAFEQTGNGLRVVTRHVREERERSGSVDLRIQAPYRCDVDLDSMGGGLTLLDLEGRFNGKTMGGALTLENVKGEAHLTTMGGQIRVTDSELDGKLETMGGKVLLKNVLGDVKGSSMGGHVRYVNVRRRDGSMAAPRGTEVPGASEDTIQISTMGGAIELPEAPAGASVMTMGGRIDIAKASRFVKAKTMGGDIFIESLDGWVEATTMGGDVELRIEGSGGGRDVTLTSMSGEITLHAPPDLPMDLELEIQYTRNSSQDFSIISDFDLTLEHDESWDLSHGSPRRTIRATGKVNGGGNRVRIKTINGNIRIQ